MLTIRSRIFNLLKARSGFQFLLILPFVALVAGSPRPRFFDLDTDMPAGPPADWARGVPVQTPVFPPVRTQSRAPVASGPAVDTLVELRIPTKVTDLRSLKSLSLSESITIDVTGHIPWTDPGRYGNGAGGGQRAVPIEEWERVYWVGLVPLLRVLLHPEQCPRPEVTAHLIEVGDAALPAARAGLSEGALRDICSEVVGAVGTPPPANVKYLEGSSPYEKMLFRFVASELLAKNPYDPQGNFGRRLEMLGDEVVPYVLAYLNHEHATLRRNAVSALALFRTRGLDERILQIALTSTDGVVRMRTLGLLTRASLDSAQIKQLCAALEKEKNTTFIARYIHTLGELRDPVAVPYILNFAKKFQGNGDMLPGCLAALARIGAGGPKGEVPAFALQIYKKATTSPSAWNVTLRSAEEADTPDPPNGRTILIRQLAIVTLIKTASPDAERERELIQLASPGFVDLDPKARAIRSSPWGARSSELGSVAPYLQFDFLEALAKLGGAANDALETVARRATSSTIARAYAMRLMPEKARTILAKEWIDIKNNAPVELATAALEALDQSSAEEFNKYADDLLLMTRFGNEIFPLSMLAPRAAALTALRLLAIRRATPADRIAKFIQSLRPRKSVVAEAVIKIKERVSAAVDVAAGGAAEAKIHDTSIEFVEFIGTWATFYELSNPGWRQVGLNLMRDALKRLAAKPKDKQLKASTLEMLTNYFTGPILNNNPDMRAKNDVITPLDDAIILMSGRTNDPAVLESLKSALQVDGFAHLPAALAALAQMRARSAAKLILPFLLHEDGFVRLNAYRALRAITGQDYFADWIAGASMDFAKASLQYQQWIEK